MPYCPAQRTQAGTDSYRAPLATSAGPEQVTFYDTPGSTATGEPRNGTTTMTSQDSPQTGHVPPRTGWERAISEPQGEGGRAMEVERTQSSNTAEAPEPAQGQAAAQSSRQGSQGRKRNRNRSRGQKETAAKRAKTG